MIKLSIVTPTYNRIELLKKNISSIKNQTFKNIEHIIIDNMSNDGTDKLIENYKKKVKYPVIYIREPDKGIYNAMNKGIRASNGEWIHILNSDDRYFNYNVLEKIFNKKITPYDLIACPILLINKNKKNKEKWLPEYIEGMKYHHFPHPGTIIKKKFYEKYGYYSEFFKIISDAIYNGSHYQKAKFLILDEILVKMRLEGISTKRSFRFFIENIISYLFFYKWPFKFKFNKLKNDLSSEFNELKYFIKKNILKK